MLSNPTLVSAAPADYDAVVGAYLSAMSIVIVYHLFALQTWLESVARLVDEVTIVEREAELDDLRRLDVATRLVRVRRDFPLVQLLIVGAAVAAVGSLALVAATRGTLTFLFWGSPTIVLMLVFVASTFATWIRGKRLLIDARKLLGVTD